MADSKSAGRWAVWVRVPLRVQGRLGALTGSAARSRAGLLGWFLSRDGGPLPAYLPLPFGGGRAGWVLSVVNAPVWVAVAKSPTSVCKMGVVGKGGTCCFMCVVGVAVLWGPRLRVWLV